MPEHFSVTIVLVEDDPGHARLIERNLRRAHITNDLVVLRDGQEAVEYFFPEGEDVAAGRVMPLLVLLDLNLPGSMAIRCWRVSRRTSAPGASR